MTLRSMGKMLGKLAHHQLIWFFLLAIVWTNVHSAEPPIVALTFAPDGKSVLAGSQAGVAEHRWPDLERLKMIRTSLVNVHDIVFSPNGKSIAVAGGAPAEAGGIQVLSAEDHRVVIQCNGHDDSVLAAVWLDDDTIASASLDNKIGIWDVASGKNSEWFLGHSRGVTSLCVLARKQLLVSGSLDQNLRVWDLPSAKVVRSLSNHTHSVNRIEKRPGAVRLPVVASISKDKTVRIWQPTIGRLVRFVKLESVPLDLAWLPDGSAIAVTAEDGQLRLIDPDTVEVTKAVRALDGWAYSVAVHPTDGSIVVGGQNGVLKRIERLNSAN